MFVKYLFLVCCFTTGAHTQGPRPSCAQIDFNNATALNAFEPCEELEMLGIRSYDDIPLEPFRNDVEYHLGNIQIGFSCVRTTEEYNLDINTEIDSLIYLNKMADDFDSYVEILAFDTVNGDVYTVGTIDVSNNWNLFTKKFTRYINNAKIEIHVYVSADALLAIEYLHLVNPTKAEQYCRRIITTTTTTTTTTTEPTEPETEATEPETEPTEPETEPTEPQTEPTTELETEPTEPETEPTTVSETEPTTEPETESTEPETEPTEPSTEPTEPETEPTEPETEPTEPETEPTEPETEPTEPETEPTELETEPTEPATEPTSTTTTSTTTTMTTTEPTEPATEAATESADPDTTHTVTESTSTQIPTDSNESTVWIILSFTFLLTTVIAAATILYLVYLYKTAITVSNSLQMSATTSSTLPRLTIAHGYDGQHVIVGMDSSVMKPKYL